MNSFYIPLREYKDVRFYIAFDENDYIYYVDAFPRYNFSIPEYLSINKVVRKMTYIGSIDFYDGDFDLHAFQAVNIIEAYAIHKTYVKEHFGEHIKEISQISVCDTRYVSKMLADM